MNKLFTTVFGLLQIVLAVALLTALVGSLVVGEWRLAGGLAFSLILTVGSILARIGAAAQTTVTGRGKTSKSSDQTQ